MTTQTDRPPRDAGRRQFLVDTLRSACGVGLFGLGLGLFSGRASSLPAMRLRPPGALPEGEFEAACIRCGLCVRDCPYDILHLADVADQDLATGTPYFIARTDPCQMCEDIPCIQHCPTPALDRGLDDINESRMGLAVLVDQETCIAYLGLRCEVCFNICPIRGEAITLEYRHNPRSGKHALFLPIVHSDACTGCGLCEHACILDEAAIKVFPLKLAKGELGKHYRLGWKEKAKHGGALVTPDVEHHYNLPKGVEYDLQGKGLIIEDQAGKAKGGVPETPFSSNPLDTLNNSSLGRP